MKSTLTPLAVGQMLDCTSRNNRESVLSSALSAAFNCEIECKITDAINMVEIRICKSEEHQYESLLKFVFSIPTINDDGEYTATEFAFNHCVVVMEKWMHFRRAEDAESCWFNKQANHNDEQ